MVARQNSFDRPKSEEQIKAEMNQCGSRDAAEFLGITPQTLRSWCDRGLLEHEWTNKDGEKSRGRLVIQYGTLVKLDSKIRNFMMSNPERVRRCWPRIVR